jgi:VanZ family protein
MSAAIGPVTRRRRLSWALFAVWTCLVVAALLVPVDRMPKVFWRGLDKVSHTAMFTVMGTLAQAAAPWAALAVALPLAVGLELAQKRLPYRTYDNVELLANVIGVVVGLGLYETAVRLRR